MLIPRIVSDATTGMSKGYGFVRFSDEGESLRSLAEMNGMFIGSRAIRVSTAQSRNAGGVGGNTSRVMNAFAALPPSQGTPFINQPFKTHLAISGSEKFNTTIFVGGVDQYMSEEELKGHFLPFGKIVSVKVSFYYLV
jgi:RNA recognition motif-containing protein